MLLVRASLGLLGNVSSLLEVGRGWLHVDAYIGHVRAATLCVFCLANASFRSVTL